MLLLSQLIDFEVSVRLFWYVLHYKLKVWTPDQQNRCSHNDHLPPPPPPFFLIVGLIMHLNQITPVSAWYQYDIIWVSAWLMCSHGQTN